MQAVELRPRTTAILERRFIPPSVQLRVLLVEPQQRQMAAMAADHVNRFAGRSVDAVEMESRPAFCETATTSKDRASSV